MSDARARLKTAIRIVATDTAGGNAYRPMLGPETRDKTWCPLRTSEVGLLADTVARSATSFSESEPCGQRSSRNDSRLPRSIHVRSPCPWSSTTSWTRAFACCPVLPTTLVGERSSGRAELGMTGLRPKASALSPSPDQIRASSPPPPPSPESGYLRPSSGNASRTIGFVVPHFVRGLPPTTAKLPVKAPLSGWVVSCRFALCVLRVVVVLPPFVLLSSLSERPSSAALPSVRPSFHPSVLLLHLLLLLRVSRSYRDGLAPAPSQPCRRQARQRARRVPILVELGRLFGTRSIRAELLHTGWAPTSLGIAPRREPWAHSDSR